MNEISLKALFGGSKDSLNIVNMATYLASQETARYYITHARQAGLAKNKIHLHKLAMEKIAFDGHVMEFGVASGETIRVIAEMTSQVVHGFDTFRGLPEDWRTGFRSGAFSANGALPEAPSNVKFHVGLFEDTIPTWCNDNKGPVSYLHVDSDLYSSACTIFTNLHDQIVSGTVITFDEYWNYPGWQFDAFKAFQEFVKKKGVTYTYKAFVPDHQQVTVIIC